LPLHGRRSPRLLLLPACAHSQKMDLRPTTICHGVSPPPAI
jgi:hypothetical protein